MRLLNKLRERGSIWTASPAHNWVRLCLNRLFSPSNRLAAGDGVRRLRRTPCRYDVL